MARVHFPFGQAESFLTVPGNNIHIILKDEIRT